jgi:hypothetical protein
MYMLGRHKGSLVHQSGVQKLLVRVNILAYAVQPRLEIILYEEYSKTVRWKK